MGHPLTMPDGVVKEIKKTFSSIGSAYTKIPCSKNDRVPWKAGDADYEIETHYIAGMAEFFRTDDPVNVLK